jgi:hypothetical protein
MHDQLSPASVDNFWRRLFPGEIPTRLLVAEPLEGNALELEGAQARRNKCGADRYGPLHMLARAIDRTDRWRRRRLQRHPSLGEIDTQSRIKWPPMLFWRDPSRWRATP